ncbi:FAD-dependent oxidoreductase [Streptomyces olivochromogenes]|uniref:FAD-dependent oxidoreductase n=1 Tax=Streptomyces olivochromogenes TaxID=1963 RepID=UPI001F4380CF|nr:NAD(P)-binding protein [Streptomyces olivochromogenes]
MVVGAGPAGLLSAYVLASYADNVTVVERDRLPRDAVSRPGVPHDRHPHVLLKAGRDALESLLPGITRELRAAGAPCLGLPSDLLQWQDGGWWSRLPATTDIHTGSRAQLESLIRTRVLAHPSIHVVEGEVTGLLGDDDRLYGVTLRRSGVPGVPRTNRSRVEADLVVDASGRSSKAAGWLRGVGVEPAGEELVDTGLAYASRLYSSPLGTGPGGAPACYLIPGPQQPTGALVLPLEHGEHLVALTGVRGHEPPVDPAGFEEFARRLPHPLVHEWLRSAEPCSSVFGFRHTANLRRRYENSRMPAGFLAVGDALCTFNPVYGQGVTAAALAAVALRDTLWDTDGALDHRRIQRALAKVYEQPWTISAGADKQMPGAVGNAATRNAAERCLGRYLRRIQRHAAHDPEVGHAFRSVLSLSEPLHSLLAPSMLLAALRPEPALVTQPPTAVRQP